ncbi:tRNA nucleotidyltransferase [Acidisarcina polymorpha]|uniref:tRNA nucleotidyltransferase n=2 Tax=Acidisarcina polymorpha TaxID=2211140 RepID=A0A2Z5G6S3_9BACT|nr:tRNA nucleotidyltransferase [Acidisarcina polymorpha]
MIREAAREAGMTVFLTGGAVRDLTSGSPVRDLDVSVQGNALELKTKLQEAGAVLWGEHEPSQTLFARFPGSVRAEISSTRREEFPTLGKPVYSPGSILEDLRRRDFTANAMALSLNEGSYGLLMDPLNGVADLEARLLRLVSNYGFLEDPVRLIRASRFQARLGWELEEKTKARFENAKEENVIAQLSPYAQGYEVEEIVHEEDGLKILKVLEEQGWMKSLFPAWTSAKADTDLLASMREVLVHLQMQGVNPDPSAAQAQLLTSKLAPKDLTTLKQMFVRQGFVREWETQEERAKELGKRLTGKEAATPSAAWKLLTSVDPEALLWLGLTSKTAAVQARLKDFFSVWPEARQKIPYALMQEMRIVPELEGYQELVKNIFFELIDGRLSTEEEMRLFLEPYSPPAPPPPVSIRRTRSKKSAEKSRELRDEDDEELVEGRAAGDDDEGDEDVDSDEESETADERAELIPRSVLRSVPQLVDEPVTLQQSTERSADHESSAPAPKQGLSGTARIDETLKKTESPVRPGAAAPVKDEPKPEVKPASKTPTKHATAIKHADTTEAKPAVHSPGKAAGHPVLKAQAHKSTSSPAPTKSLAKPAPKSAAKGAVKSKPIAKPSGKKSSAVKKAATKGKVLIKPKVAKPPVKAKPAADRVGSAAKSRAAGKVSAKSSAKSALARKKR